MQRTLNLLMAQINPIVGDIVGNAEKIITIIRNYQYDHDVIIFPELALTGYPPEDLLLRDALFAQVDTALLNIQAVTEACWVIIGHPQQIGAACYNAASILNERHCVATYHKQFLPNYGVFDEKRYFIPGPADPCVFNIKGYQVGLCICEDLWQQTPVDALISANADILLCINASPFDDKKYALREALVQQYARHFLAIVYVNQIGGQDELLFDGQSFAVNNSGQISARAPAFVESLQTVKLKENKLEGHVTPLLSNDALIYQALVCALRDYVEKNNFPGVLLGLSGGIDSALTLAIAVDALGSERVHAVMMPSQYTAAISKEDALLQLDAMQVTHSTLTIEPLFELLLTTLAPEFKGLAADTTEENLQARIRGILLMALSNKTGKMVLSTSNKSETAVGYATLYGDMVGGFAVLKDVLKTQVYQLARYRNSLSPVIPERVLTRPPSAELAFGQTDQDSLPEYAILDEIISLHMELNLQAEEIITCGYQSADVYKVLQLIKRNEYKRHQAAPGVKISTRAFGRDWRYPITSGFR